MSSLAIAAPPVTIHNPWLVNDRVADTHNLSTMAATYVNSYTPNGVVLPANNQAKAVNIYDNQKRRMYHWADEPPSVGGNDINDPTYNQNVFGWGLCGRHACNGCTIAKAAGFGERKIAVPGDWQMEFIYDGGNHLFHSMMTYYVFTRGSNPHIASCDEIKADNNLVLNAVAEGRACPGFLLCGDTAPGEVSMVNSYSDGGDAAVTTRWTGNMDLRTGQVFKRTWESWFNEHPTPHTDADGISGVADAPFHHEANKDYKDWINIPYWEPYALNQTQDYALNIGHPISYRRWSNGTDTLTPDFRSAAYQALLYSSTNIATYNDDSLTPDLHAAAIGTTSEAVFKINVPFYVTDASFSGDFVKTSSGDVCNVQVSTDGSSWTTVWTASALGTTHVANQSLRNNVFGAWNIWYIKVQFKATVAKNNAGVSNFVVVTTFEHNKGSMAYLDNGVNHITVNMDNPTDLGSTSMLKVTYKWKEYDGTDWTIDKTCVKYFNTSPATFTVVTGGPSRPYKRSGAGYDVVPPAGSYGAVPRTEYIQMEVVPTPPADTTPPSAVTDLACGTGGRTTIPLTWTAPGNDGTVGEASGYDLRYSTSPIDDSSFSSATQVANVTWPRPYGGAESFTVTGLAQGTTYYFAIKAFDDAGNYGPISNLPSGSTMTPDTQAPNAINNLTVTTTGTLGAFSITWTAPSDNGNGYVAAYDLRWSGNVITDANFSSATQISLSAPKSPGSAESFTTSGFATGKTLYFAIKSADDAGNWSAISNLPSARQNIGMKTFQNGLNGYTGCMDSYINKGSQSADYSTQTYLILSGGASSTNVQRTLVKFDLTSIPSTSVITKATLYMYAYSNEQHDARGGSYGAYHIYTGWPAGTHGLTWNQPWAVSGGSDCDGSPDTLTPKQATTGVWYAFDVTSRVQRFISGADANNGWCLHCYEEGYSNTDWFYSCRSTVDPTLRPKLVIADTDDVTPPAAVSDLTISNVATNSLQLSWTAPGDDGNTGTATAYDIRYYFAPITGTNWGLAIPVTGIPTPAVAGTNQTLAVSGLLADQTYYFAIKTVDDVGNWSTLSNVPSIHTADSVAPAAVSNLAASGRTTTSITLTWTATGDNGTSGTATSYNLRYSTDPITDLASFNAATPVTGLSAPKAAGSTESFTVSGLTPTTTYNFALVVSDEAGNASGLSNVFTYTTMYPRKAGDINYDNYVNVGDLQLLVAAWGSDNSGAWGNWNPYADLNSDGHIDVSDLQILVSNWGN